MIHEIAGHLVYLPNVVCIFPFRYSPRGGTPELEVLTVGGRLTIALDAATAEADVAEFRDRMALLNRD